MTVLGDYFIGKVFDGVAKILAEITAGGPNPFAEIRRRNGEEAAFEFTLAFERLVRKLEAANSDIRERLRETVTEREVYALFPMLLQAAAAASTRERMRMLCAALAGVWRPDATAEERSRVARIVRDLEPSDILYLREIANPPARPRRASEIPADERHMRVMSRTVLISTGCLTIHVEEEAVGDALAKAARNRRNDLRGLKTNKTEREIATALGRAVLAAMETWEPEKLTSRSP